MATDGNVPILGWKAGAIKWLVTHGFNVGTAAAGLPPVRIATVRRVQTSRTVCSEQAVRQVKGLP